MFIRLKFLTVIFLFSVLLGCSASNDNSVVPTVSPEDLHNYEFWTQESIDGANTRMAEAYTDSKKEVERLYAIEHKTYMNFIRPYTDITDKLYALMPYPYSNYISADAKLQGIMDKHLQMDADYNQFLMKYDADMIAAIDYIKQSEALNSAQIIVLENLRKLSVGATLPKEKQERVLAINARLAVLNVEYDRNLVASAPLASIRVADESLLGDMPQWMKGKYVSVFGNDDVDARIQPIWTFAPYGESFRNFMQYVPDRELRKRMYKSANEEKNKPIITEMLALRHEKAVIFGFDNYAEYRIKTEMSASSVREVKDVLEYNIAELKKLLRPQKQLALKLAQEDGIENLEPYDNDYYMRLAIMSETKEVDTEKLFASYFEKWKTVDGIFDKFGQMYNIKFEKQSTMLWNATAKKYEIWRKDGEFVGTLFIDFDSSPLKVGGAFVMGIIKRHLDKNNTLIKPVVFMLLNFPADEKESTVTLTYRNIVSTFMHELGHSIHHFLPKPEETLASGMENFKRDNMEYMSAFHEMLPLISNEILQDISESVDNGTKIPTEFLDSYMKTAKRTGAYNLLDTGISSLMDLSIYSGLYNYEEAYDIVSEIGSEYGIIEPLTSFPHIFSYGYDASYYIYLWGQRNAADSLLYMKDTSGKLGLNEAKLNDFYEKLVKPAGTKEFMELYKDFRGDGFDKDALIKIFQ